MRNKRKDSEYKQKCAEYMKEYWVKNDPYEYNKKLMERNPEYKKRYYNKIKEYHKSDRAKELNKKYNNKRRKTKEYKEWKNNYEKEKRDNDITYRLLINLKNRINGTISGKKYTKNNIKLIGCTRNFLRDYLETLFNKNMTWDNYGRYWHIDHIVPCNFFDFTIKENQFICFNYRNLQPLSVSENCSKQDSLPRNYQGIILNIKKALKLY